MNSMRSTHRGLIPTTLLWLLCAALVGGCATERHKLTTTVLSGTHYMLMTKEQAPDAYALPGVKTVWRITDVGLEELHQVQMQAKQ